MPGTEIKMEGRWSLDCGLFSTNVHVGIYAVKRFLMSSRLNTVGFVALGTRGFMEFGFRTVDAFTLQPNFHTGPVPDSVVSFLFLPYFILERVHCTQ